MVASKLRKARNAQKAATEPNLTHLVIAAISLIGLGPVVAMVLLFLVVIVVIAGVASSTPDPNASAGSGDAASTLIGGNGKGALATGQIPQRDLVKPIQDAGRVCDLVGPAVLAAQIEVESQFDPDRTGPDGKVGISQLPPDAFTRFGKDDDHNGEVSALDPTDSIFAQARYLCWLGEEIKKLLDDQKIVGDRLTLTLLAWNQGLDAVTQAGGTPIVAPQSYPFQVRALFARYLSGEPEPSPATSGAPAPGPSARGPGAGPGAPGLAALTAARFDEMFPGRIPFYSYPDLVAAMAKVPAFAGTGDDTVRRREVAAFLANVSHETRGLAEVHESNRAAWGDYCDTTKPYGCPAGQTAYHGRGPLQLSWNYNYQAAGAALGVDLLHDPDQVSNDPAVAWDAALWFWMTQSHPGATTGHDAITSGAGFGGTINSINGGLECNGGRPDQVQDRVAAYQRFAGILGVTPGDRLTC